MSIQSSINSMLGSANHAIMAVRGIRELSARKAEKEAKENAKTAAKQSKQKQAAERARQSVANAVEAKKTQKRNFMDYLRKQDSSLGKIGDLSPDLQQKIAKSYTPSMRKKLMDSMDKEKKR